MPRNDYLPRAVDDFGQQHIATINQMFIEVDAVLHGILPEGRVRGMVFQRLLETKLLSVQALCDQYPVYIAPQPAVEEVPDPKNQTPEERENRPPVTIQEAAELKSILDPIAEKPGDYGLMRFPYSSRKVVVNRATGMVVFDIDGLPMTEARPEVQSLRVLTAEERDAFFSSQAKNLVDEVEAEVQQKLQVPPGWPPPPDDSVDETPQRERQIGKLRELGMGYSGSVSSDTPLHPADVADGVLQNDPRYTHNLTDREHQLLSQWGVPLAYREQVAKAVFTLMDELIADAGHGEYDALVGKAKKKFDEAMVAGVKIILKKNKQIRDKHTVIDETSGEPD